MESENKKYNNENNTLCPYFGKCGGCSVQHIPYEVQLKNKKKLVSELLKYDIDKINIFSDDPFHYRNRMDFIYNGRLGLREKGNWKSIVNIDSCMISNERINKFIKELDNLDIEPFNIINQKGILKYVVIRTPRNNYSITFVLNKDSMKIMEATTKIEDFSKKTKANNVIVAYVGKKQDMSISDDFYIVKGSEFLYEIYLGRKFFFHTQSFFQNNTIMAEKMLNYVRGLLDKYGNREELLDLYGGVGLFGLNLSELYNSIKIVESVDMSIKCADMNIKENKIDNAEAFVMDAKLINKLKFNNVLDVITDPPRSGMHKKAIKNLLDLKPKRIIYISCNIKQTSKEIKEFLKYYELKSVAVFDLFPQTNHMEVILELERKKENII